MNLSPRAAERLSRLLTTLDRDLDQMEGSVEVHELVTEWRGSLNIRDNIREFVDWQRRKLPS
jgi:hypothetical protein